MVRHYIVTKAKSVLVEDGQQVKAGQSMYVDEDETDKQAPFDGTVSLDSGILTITGVVNAEESISVLPDVGILVEDGARVHAGDQLTEGALDPKDIADVAGITVAQRYILNEAQKVYDEQGISIDDIHIEVILRQMARLGKVVSAGDSSYLVGSFVSQYMADVKNELLKKEGKNKALVLQKLFGIKTSSLNSESFLSAMSFQEQVRVLTSTAILGKTDYLRGMKENVIIGRRIPAGEEAEIKDIYSLEELKN